MRAVSVFRLGWATIGQTTWGHKGPRRSVLWRRDAYGL